MNQQRRGGGEPAYGSVHRRLDHPRGGGGYGGPLKHSLFGNQVFNVSGSRDHHHGNHLLYGRNDSNYNTFGEIFSKVQSSEIIRKVHCLMIFFEKELFTFYIELQLQRRHNMASGCNSLQFSQKFEKLKAPNLSSDLDGVIYICEAWPCKYQPPRPASRLKSRLQHQVNILRTLRVKRCKCINTHLIPATFYISNNCRWGPAKKKREVRMDHRSMFGTHFSS